MSNFPEKKHYEGVRFNVISITSGWVGVQFPGKKRYVTLEWPLTTKYYSINTILCCAKVTSNSLARKINSWRIHLDIQLANMRIKTLPL